MTLNKKVYDNMLAKLFLNHDATGHKLAHNLTTILNIPLVAWLIYTLISLRDAAYEDVGSWFTHPLNMVVGILFVFVTLKHFTLEIEVVIEDYVSNIPARKCAIIALKVIWLVLGLTTTISILKLGLT